MIVIIVVRMVDPIDNLVAPTFDVLAERPEQVPSQLPNDSTVLSSSPRRTPQHRTCEDTNDEEPGAEQDRPENVGEGEVISSGGGWIGVNGGLGSTRD